MRQEIQLGLLYSRSGAYARIGDACLDGARAAVADVNADPDRPIRFSPLLRDPGGNIDAYPIMAAELLERCSVRHIIGCVTSWSRKEVIPVLERAGGTLWYGCPYEGFEASDHVVYTHACTNQHLLPLLHWAFPRFGHRGYLTGSNYIWGWEINRVARAAIAESGGETLGERYLPIGSTDIARMIEEIRETQPDFVLNSLIGESSYAFLDAIRQLREVDPRFADGRCPVLSCNLTECELGVLGDAAEGLISVGPYFAGEAWPYGAAHRRFASSFEAAPYAAVMMLADLLSAVPDRTSARLDELLRANPATSHPIDATTHHTKLPVLIAEVRGGAFHVIGRKGIIAADPYLGRTQIHAPERRARLKVVK